jgi:hypothetical protein
MVTAKDYNVVSCHLELFSICVESNVVKVEMFLYDFDFEAVVLCPALRLSESG